MVFGKVVFLVIEILTGIGIATVGSMQANFAKRHCYSIDGLEAWMVVVGLVISLWAVAGLYLRYNSYSRCYLVHIVINVLLFFAFLTVLIIFWRVVATSHHRSETLWREKLNNKLNKVIACYRSHDHCGRTQHIRECCEPPPSCEQQPITTTSECAQWKKSLDGMCYSCDGCMRATFFKSRAYGQKMNPALISLFIILVLTIGGLLYVECNTAGGYICREILKVSYWREGPGQLG